MEYYKDSGHRRGQRMGIAAAAIYFAVWAVLMLLLKFSLAAPAPQGLEGILVDLGEWHSGGAGAAIAAAPPPVATDDAALLTQDYEEASVIAAPTSTQVQTPVPRTEPAATSTPTSTPQRQVDQRAIFPGSAVGGAGSMGAGSGTGTEAGRQGTPFGTPGGDPGGTGLGTSGVGFDLAGRNLIGSLPLPEYGPNKSGRVVVDITVDREGRVTQAFPRAQGSTTTDSELIHAATAAALKARFDMVDDDGLKNGTITYNFILK